MSTTYDPKKEKRKPGRPKQDFHYESITITLPPDALIRLEEQAAATGRSRSNLLWRAWEGLPLIPKRERTPEQVEYYRHLVKLATNLNQLMVLARVGQDVQAQARVTLNQVQQLLSKLNEGEVL